MSRDSDTEFAPIALGFAFLAVFIFGWIYNNPEKAAVVKMWFRDVWASLF